MDTLLREKIRAIVDEYNRLNEKMASPEVACDPEAYRRLVKTQREMEDIVQAYQLFELKEKHLNHTEEVIKEETDFELISLAQEEKQSLQQQLSELEQKLRILLLPKDPNDEKNTIIEIRAGTGGEEAGLFVADLYRMYIRFAEKKGWKVELLDSHPTELGGYKEICFQISGQSVYSQLKYEGGVHRVQRVPETEAQGRIHTSAVTVAVLPEADEIDIEIDPKDLQIDVYRSSGHGGQGVNTTDSAVRITHVPTGIVVTCQDERSQHKNKARALKVLRSRLLDIKTHEEQKTRSEHRKIQVGSGDRSERIRTYNFPQNRVTEHRIGLTLYSLDKVLDGELQPIIDALVTADQAERLAQLAETETSQTK